MFKQENRTTQDRNRARTLKALLEANAKWNAECRKLAGQDLQQLVDDTSTIDPDLRKELLYSWERGFVEDKPKGSEWNNQSVLRRDKNRRNGAALNNPLKGKVAAETPKTITTASGSIYRKSDLAKRVVPVKNIPNEGTSQKEKAKSPLEEPKSNHQKKNVEPEEETESEEEDRNLLDEQAKERFRNSHTIVTSRDTPTGGGLNLAVRRAKPNQGGPTMGGGQKLRSKWQLEPKERSKIKNSCNSSRGKSKNKTGGSNKTSRPA